MLAFAPPPPLRGRPALATKFVCDAIGDSHTFNNSFGLTAAQFHPFLTQTALQRLGCSEAIVNDGVSGNTTGQVLVRARLLPAVTTGSLAIIYCGTNDWNTMASVQASPSPTTTVFAVDAGLGSHFQPNTSVLVNGVSRVIQSVSTDTITLTSPLPGAPTAGTSVVMDTAQNIIDTATQMAAKGYTRQIIGRQHYLNFATGGDTLVAEQSIARLTRMAQDQAIAAVAGCVVADFYTWMRNLIVAGKYTQGDDLAWHVDIGNSHLNATGQQILSDCIMAAISDAWLGGLRSPYDVDTLAWSSAVVANGGTVSDFQKGQVDLLIATLKAAGDWSVMEDCLLLVAENPTQALTSLKQRRLATAVNSPTFTANRGYSFDGATNYINTNFIPSAHAVVMTGSDLWAGVYERTNLAASRFHGAYNNSSQNIDWSPRSGSAYSAGANSTVASYGTSTDSRGLIGPYRTATSVFGTAKNGVSAATYSPAVNGTNLVNVSLAIGCENVSGVFGNFRAATVGALVMGKSTAGLSPTLYAALQAYMTAWGANV